MAANARSRMSVPRLHEGRDSPHLISWSGAIMGTAPSGYARSVPGTSPALANYVEAMVDWDFACPDQAEALTLKLIPGTAPLLVIHYRTPIPSTWQFGSSASASLITATLRPCITPESSCRGRADHWVL
jgi:hypothetical protein